MSAWVCYSCPFPLTSLPLKCAHTCNTCIRTKGSEIQHLPFACKDGTLISRMKNSHLKGQLERRSVQQSPGVVKTGPHGSHPAGVRTDLQGGPPEQASRPNLGLLRAEGWLWIYLPEMSREGSPPTGSNKDAAGPASWRCQLLSKTLSKGKQPASIPRTEPFLGSLLHSEGNVL